MNYQHFAFLIYKYNINVGYSTKKGQCTYTLCVFSLQEDFKFMANQVVLFIVRNLWKGSNQRILRAEEQRG